MGHALCLEERTNKKSLHENVSFPVPVNGFYSLYDLRLVFLFRLLRFRIIKFHINVQRHTHHKLEEKPGLLQRCFPHCAGADHPLQCQLLMEQLHVNQHTANFSLHEESILETR